MKRGSVTRLDKETRKKSLKLHSDIILAGYNVIVSSGDFEQLCSQIQGT